MLKYYINHKKIVSTVDVIPAPAGIDTPNAVDMFLTNGFAYDTDKLYEGKPLYETLDDLKLHTDTEVWFPLNIAFPTNDGATLIQEIETGKKFITDVSCLKNKALDSSKFAFCPIPEVKVGVVSDISYGNGNPATATPYYIVDVGNNDNVVVYKKEHDHYKNGDVMFLSQE